MIEDHHTHDCTEDPLRYVTYLRLVTRVFHHFGKYYGALEEASDIHEAESMALYATKFLATVFALRLKYRFSPVYMKHPTVGLTESGFPRFDEIAMLDADRSTRDERLPKLRDLEVLKEELLDHLMSGLPSEDDPAYQERLQTYRKDETACLWRVAERAYLDFLDLRKQFFTFTPGKLFPLEKAETDSGVARRSYLFSWGCYDAQSSTPCVYFMLFEQDASESPLDAKDNPDYLRFLETVRAIGSRAPANLMAVAARLDQSLETLYPKVLKCFRIGPLVSPLLTRSIENLESTSLAARLRPIFERAELTERDYALFFRTEYVHSDREVKPNGFYAKLIRGKPQQVFHVPKSDRELLEAGVTAVRTYLLIPHQFLQHLLPEDRVHAPELENVEHIIYPENNEGDVIDVG